MLVAQAQEQLLGVFPVRGALFAFSFLLLLSLFSENCPPLPPFYFFSLLSRAMFSARFAVLAVLLALAAAQQPAVSILRPGVLSVSAPELAASLQSLLALTHLTPSPCPESAPPSMVVRHAGDKVLEVDDRVNVEFAELPGVCVAPTLAELSDYIALPTPMIYAKGELAESFLAAKNLPAYSPVDGIDAVILPATNLAIGGINVRKALEAFHVLADPSVCVFPLSGLFCHEIAVIDDCNDSPVKETGSYLFSDTMEPGECVFVESPTHITFPGDLTWRLENIDYTYVSPNPPVIGYRMSTSADPEAAFFYNPADNIVYAKPLCKSSSGDRPCEDYEFGSIQLFSPGLLNATYGVVPRGVKCCQMVKADINTTAVQEARGRFYLVDGMYTRIEVVTDDMQTVWSSWELGQPIGHLYRRKPLQYANERPNLGSHQFGPLPILGLIGADEIPPAMRRPNWDPEDMHKGVHPIALKMAFRAEFVFKRPPTSPVPHLVFGTGPVGYSGSYTFYVVNDTLYYTTWLPYVFDVATEKLFDLPDHWVRISIDATTETYEETLAYVSSDQRKIMSNITFRLDDSKEVRVRRQASGTIIRLEMPTLGTLYTPAPEDEGPLIELVENDITTRLQPLPPDCFDFASGFRIYFSF